MSQEPTVTPDNSGVGKITAEAALAGLPDSEAAGAVLHETEEQRRKRILRERAQKLARRPKEVEAEEEVVELIEFTLGHENYAIEVKYVREVYPIKDLTPVPCTPTFVLGILNVRGQIISVTDFRKFFDLPNGQITDESRVIIVENEKLELGILADSVLGEKRIPRSRIQSQTPVLRGINENYLKGVTEGRTAILNMERLLSDESIVVHEEVDH
jgi:purine-binding chemotaxis protein CheW